MTQEDFEKIAKRFNLLVARNEKKRRTYLIRVANSGESYSVLLEISDVEIKFLPDNLIEERIVKTLTNSLW